MTQLAKVSRISLVISRKVIVNILLILIFNSLCIAGEVESKVDEYIEAHIKNNSFSGSIFIAQGGKIVMCKGYGMANLELDVPNTTKTKYRLSSVSKQFAAMAVMQLHEKGLINVDDPLAKYILDYQNGDKITIHHLLTHTAGIPNITDFPELQEIKTLKSPVEKTIERFKSKPLEFTPGERYKYSNSGYILLGYIIEKVSGKSYEDYLQENIFNPLNMKDSGYDHHRSLLKNRAAGYCWGKDGIGNADYIDMSLPHAGGGLYSTVEDLYLWDRALYTDKLVTKSSSEKMFTPFLDDYGYGWRIEKVLNRKCVRHAGGIEGFQAQISRFVDDDVCIIVLSNFEFAKVPEICKDLAAILFGEKYEIPAAKPLSKIDPSKIDDYVGTYEFEPDNILNVSKEDNRLFIATPGQPLVEIFAMSENKFLVKAFNAELTFVRNNKDEVTELIFHVGGQGMRAKKLNK